MEPQINQIDGDTENPLRDDFARGQSALGPDWSQFYTSEDTGAWNASSGEDAKWVESATDDQLIAESGIEPVLSTADVAEYFDRTTQWVYWGLKPDPQSGEIRFVWPDGTPIVPERIGHPIQGRRRFTTVILRAILESCYRRGNISSDELKTILRRIRYTEVGVEWRQREGWKYVDLGRNKHRWVRPENAVLDKKTKTWKRRKVDK